MNHLQDSGSSSESISKIQRCYRRYKERLADFVLIRAVTTIQCRYRGRVARSYYSKRFAQAEQSLMKKVISLLDSLLEDDVLNNHAVYHGLFRILETGPSSMLNHVSSNIRTLHMESIVKDLGSEVREVRILCCRFISRICHKNMGVQRLLLQVNGISMPNHRIFSVPNSLLTLYRNWCEQQDSKSSELGFVSFIKSVVSDQLHRTDGTTHSLSAPLDEGELYGQEEHFAPSTFKVSIQHLEPSKSHDPKYSIFGITLPQFTPKPLIYPWEWNQLDCLARVFRIATVLESLDGTTSPKEEFSEIDITTKEIKMGELVGVKYFMQALYYTQLLRFSSKIGKLLTLPRRRLINLKKACSGTGVVLHKALQVLLQDSRWVLHATGINGTDLLHQVFHNTPPTSDSKLSTGEKSSRKVAPSKSLYISSDESEVESNAPGLEPESPRKDGDKTDQMLHNLVLKELLQSKLKVEWVHLSKICASVIWEQSVCDRLGRPFLDSLWELFVKTEKPGNGVSVECKTTLNHKGIEFRGVYQQGALLPRGNTRVRRRDVLFAFREPDTVLGSSANSSAFEKALSASTWFRVRERTAAPLLAEDPKLGEQLAGTCKYVSATTIVSKASQLKAEDNTQFADGSCPWDWITWIELLTIMREVACPSKAPSDPSRPSGFLSGNACVLQAFSSGHPEDGKPLTLSKLVNFTQKEHNEAVRKLNASIHTKLSSKKHIIDPLKSTVHALVLWAVKTQLDSHLHLLCEELAKFDPFRAPVATSKKWLSKLKPAFTPSYKAFERYHENRMLLEEQNLKRFENFKQKESRAQKHIRRIRRQRQSSIQANKKLRDSRRKRVSRFMKRQVLRTNRLQRKAHKMSERENRRRQDSKKRTADKKSEKMRHDFICSSKMPRHKPRNLKSASVPVVEPSPPKQPRKTAPSSIRAKRYDQIVQARNKLIVGLKGSLRDEDSVKPARAEQQSGSGWSPGAGLKLDWAEDAAAYWTAQYVASEANTAERSQQDSGEDITSRILEAIPQLPTLDELRAMENFASGIAGVKWREVRETPLLSSFNRPGSGNRLSHRVAATIAKQLERKQVALNCLSDFKQENPYGIVDDDEFLQQVEETLLKREENDIYKRITGRTKDAWERKKKMSLVKKGKNHADPESQDGNTDTTSNSTTGGLKDVCIGATGKKSQILSHPKQANTLDKKIMLSILHDNNLHVERINMVSMKQEIRRSRVLLDLETRMHSNVPGRVDDETNEII